MKKYIAKLTLLGVFFVSTSVFALQGLNAVSYTHLTLPTILLV